MIRKIRLSDSFTCGKMLRFALPSLVMNVFTSLYSVVDGFFVANYAGTASWQRSSIEDKKGSITAGKEADFLVFDKDLLTAQKEGFSYNKPADVYFAGKKVN